MEDFPEHTGSDVEKNRVPAIDRAARILNVLERHPSGIGIRELSERVGAPRTTVYRIVNSLHDHGLVRRSPSGDFLLGPRILALAAQVTGDDSNAELARLARPHLERLSNTIGQGCKVSVLLGRSTLVIAAGNSAQEYSLMQVTGQRVPLHAGAAGKVLLASMSVEQREAYVRAGLGRHTGETITDADALFAELDEIAARGWAEDVGEFTQNVCAYAAPIRNQSGATIAALSVPFIAGGPPDLHNAIREAVITFAGAISADCHG